MLSSVPIFLTAYLSVILALGKSVGLSSCPSICLPVRPLACLFTKQPVCSLFALQSASSSDDRRGRRELSQVQGPIAKHKRSRGTREAGRLRSGWRCDRIDHCVLALVCAGVCVCLLRGRHRLEGKQASQPGKLTRRQTHMNTLTVMRKMKRMEEQKKKEKREPQCTRPNPTHISWQVDWKENVTRCADLRRSGDG